MLRADGYSVNEVNDGDRMLEQLRALVPASGEPSPGVLAICDYRLKDSDALSVLRQLRTEARIPRFILITGFWSSQVYSQAKDLGALAVFAKPFDFEDLRIVVRYLYANSGSD
jgi:CheY-like chemotaxis protein